MQDVQGIITEIQRFSIHDGPGIRTTVFLKGCNLRCAWCHNPETISGRPEIQTFPERCIACGACQKACPHGAMGPQGLNRALCQACGSCAEVCYAEALVRVGRRVSAGDVVREVLADREFYRNSGGGVTLSGGEPLLQPAFARAVLAQCKAEGLHCAIETNLEWPWERMADLLPLLDLVMFDIKAVDEASHRAWTGASNARILENARRLAAVSAPVIVRTPVVPGANDTVEEIERIATVAARFPHLQYYELLPYHPLGSGKYRSLGMDYRCAETPRPTREAMAVLAARAREVGIEVRVAGEAAG